MSLLDYEVPPRFSSMFHLVQVLVWTAMIPVALMTSLKDSVPFLVTISLLALVFSEAASFQASLAERRLDSNDTYGDTNGGNS